jgi:hypothetical protein
MATAARGLGRYFDLSMIVPIVDLDAAAGQATTSARVSLKNAAGVTFALMTGVGTTDDVQCDLQEHDAATGGTSQDLDIITTFYIKEEATLDGDETWTKVTQAVASEIAARADSAEKQTLWAIDVAAEQLSDGFTHVSLNIPDLGSAAAQWGGVLAILWGLKVQRAPENLVNPQAA